MGRFRRERGRGRGREGGEGGGGGGGAGEGYKTAENLCSMWGKILPSFRRVLMTTLSALLLLSVHFCLCHISQLLTLLQHITEISKYGNTYYRLGQSPSWEKFPPPQVDETLIVHKSHLIKDFLWTVL